MAGVHVYNNDSFGNNVEVFDKNNGGQSVGKKYVDAWATKYFDGLQVSGAGFLNFKIQQDGKGVVNYDLVSSESTVNL